MFLVNRVAACKEKLAKTGTRVIEDATPVAIEGDTLEADTPPPMPPRPDSRNSVRVDSVDSAVPRAQHAAVEVPVVVVAADADAVAEAAPVAVVRDEAPVVLPVVAVAPEAVVPEVVTPVVAAPVVESKVAEPEPQQQVPVRSPRIISVQAPPPAAAAWVQHANVSDRDSNTNNNDDESNDTNDGPQRDATMSAVDTSSQQQQSPGESAAQPVRASALRPAPQPPPVPAFSDTDATRRPTRLAPTPPAGEGAAGVAPEPALTPRSSK